MELKLIGRHQGRTARMVLLWYPRWRPWWPFWNFKPHLLPNSKSYWAETRWEALGWHGDSELLNLFKACIFSGKKYKNTQTKCWDWSGSNCLTLWWYSWKIFFEKVNLKKDPDDKKTGKIIQHAKSCRMSYCYCILHVCHTSAIF